MKKISLDKFIDGCNLLRSKNIENKTRILVMPKHQIEIMKNEGEHIDELSKTINGIPYFIRPILK